MSSNISQNEVKFKCTCSKWSSDSTKSCSKIFVENFEIKSIHDLDCLSTKAYSENHKTKPSEDTKGDKPEYDSIINDIDLKPNHHTISEVNIKSDNFNHKKQLDTLCDAKSFDLEDEQENVVDCLSDLDDYLNQIDENCFTYTKSNLNCNILAFTAGKSIPLSSNDKNSSKSNTHFERSLKFRSTNGFNFHKENLVSEHKDLSKKKTVKSFPYQQQDRKNPNTLLKYFATEVPNCSINVNKTEPLQKNINISAFELGNEHGNIEGLEVLKYNNICQNFIEQQQNVECDRPRQFGQRAESFSILSSSLKNTPLDFEHNNCKNLRSISNATSTVIQEDPYNNEILCTVSDGSTAQTSQNTELVSITASTDSIESLSITLEEHHININQDNGQEVIHPISSEIIIPNPKPGFNTHWPHNSSRAIALTSCTLGLFNISRFAILTVNYGGNFFIQFCILSIIFGIPFLWLQMSLGAKIKEGPISMWKISPICIGIGISITFVQYLIAIYSSVVVIWILKFIQDIFMNKLSYPYEEPIHLKVDQQSHIYTNLTEINPDYFNKNILRTIHILKISDEHGAHLPVKDRLAIYLALVWVAIFLILCKGLKSFGKCVFLLGTLPVVFLILIAVKLLCVIDFEKLMNLFSSSRFDDFLVNSNTWAAAAQESFLTWGLFGPSVIAISSRAHKNSSTLTLRKDAVLVVLVTLLGLCLSALIGLCLIQILNEFEYIYVPGSYELPRSYSTIYSRKSLANSDLINYQTKFVPHYSTLLGEVYRRHTDTRNVSGYQVLRFVTELLPAVVATSTDKLSWFWALIIFIAFFLFGFSQLCIMWKPISCILGNSSRAVLMSCATGLLFSIPFTTEKGITLLYFADILLGGAWFIPILWTAQIFGVFLIRGRPYNGDDLVNNLKMSYSMSAFLALSWNILLPFGLITLAIIEYKISQSSQFYHWRGQSYFNYWSRKAGALIQIAFLILIPIAAIVQICRYISSGPPDILDRIQSLYRPLDDIENTQGNNRINRNNQSCAIERLEDDSPPKYTPPPSYTTATSAKILKILHQSFRRSIRRILRDSSRVRPTLSIRNATRNDQSSDAADNIVALSETLSLSDSNNLENKPLNLIYGRSLSVGRKEALNKRRLGKSCERTILSCSNYPGKNFSRISFGTPFNRTYTTADVLAILRSTPLDQRGTARSAHFQMFSSNENFVRNAESPSQSVNDEYTNQD